jgi:hypothetical protein
MGKCNEDKSDHQSTLFVTDTIRLVQVNIAFNPSHNSVWDNVQNSFNYHKMCNKWVPKQLSHQQKMMDGYLTDQPQTLQL